MGLILKGGKRDLWHSQDMIYVYNVTNYNIKFTFNFHNDNFIMLG